MAGEDKTEKATPHKLREARKKGDVATSPEITGAVMALLSLVILQQQGSHILQGLLSLLSQDLAAAAQPGQVTEATVGAHMRGDVITGLTLLAPLALAVMIGVVAAGLLNTRALVSLQPLKPSFRKLNPINGVKHLFGKESLNLLGKVLLKLAVIALVLQSWQHTWNDMVPRLSFMSGADAASTLWADVLQLAVQLTACFLLVGALDFGYRQWAWRRRQRMTKQEVKEEYKRMEGNPQIRARIRQLGRKRLRALMSGMNLRAVPKADVVITNPTHFAIAIQYTPGKMRAPKVIAKGQRLFAQRIKEEARRHGIPLVENKPLAQALYKSVEVNKEIPADPYKAVAQVLAFVYRLRLPAQSGHRPQGPARPGLSGVRS
jgi:flagellar biosynthetic protein FlhB